MAAIHIERVQVEQDVCNAVFVGEFELTLAEQQFIQLINEAVHKGATKVLIDGRQVTGHPSAFERYLYGTFVALATLEVLQRHSARLKFAYIIHNHLLDPGRFAESVAAERGMDVKAFDDENEAREWLLGESGAAAA